MKTQQITFNAGLAALFASSLHAAPILRITEVMSSSGGTPDWFEITNVGDQEANIAGYKMDDNSVNFGASVALNNVPSIAAGESAVFVLGDATDAADFRTFWGLSSSAKVGYFADSGTGLSSNGDNVVLFNSSGTIITQVSFGSATSNHSFYYVYNSAGTQLSSGSPVSSAGSLGAFITSTSPVNTGSPGTAASSLDLAFTSSVKKFATTGSAFSSPITFQKKNGTDIASLAIVSGPAWLSLTGVTQSGGTLTGTPTTAQTGPQSVTLRLTVSGQPTVELVSEIIVFAAQPKIVLNEYSAVGGSDYHASPDGDLRLGRIEGNGGDWFELVAVGNGFGTTIDMRGWKIQVSQLSGGQRLTDTITLSNDVFWSNIPAGMILTFTEENAADGGHDTALNAENQLATNRYAWSNIFLGDNQLISSITGDSAGGVVINQDDTQIAVLDGTDTYLFGPVGEGTWRYPEINSESCFYLAADPGSGIVPSAVQSDARYSSLYFGKEPVMPSTFGLPNLSNDGIQPFFGVKPPYFSSRPHRIAREGVLTLTGVDYRQNDNHALSFTLRAKGGGAAPAWIDVFATGFAADIDLAPGAGDVGIHELELVVTDSVNSIQTVEPYVVVVLPASSEVILNEYNAVSSSNFINDGIIDESDGSDTHFGTVLGNGGDWFELVVVGNGSASTVDMRGWKIEIDDAAGNVFLPNDTLVLSQDAYWAAVPAGTILTFTEKTTSEGGLDTWIHKVNRLGQSGGRSPGDGAYAWSNIHIFDDIYIDSTNSNIGDGIGISSNNTQFRILKPDNTVVAGPVGEGIWPLSGVGNTEVLELEADPSPLTSPYEAPGVTVEESGYDDGKGSTFGSPNTYEGGTLAQDFSSYQRANSAPVFTNVPIRSVEAGAMYSFLAGTADADGQSVVVSVITKPTWLTFASGNLSGTVPGNGGGVHRIELLATDSSGGTTTLRYDLTVTAPEGFPSWAGGASPGADDDGNGYTALAEYALGAAAPGGGFELPVESLMMIEDAGYLTLTAVVRTSDASLLVIGESSVALGEDPSAWSAVDVTSVLADDQSSVPPGCERRVFRTPVGGDSRKFLRLKMEIP